MMQADQSAETFFFFNDICFCCDLQACGGVFTVERAAQCAESSNVECVQILSATEMTPECRPPPQPPFSPTRVLFLADRKVLGLIVSSICGEDGEEREL